MLVPVSVDEQVVGTVGHVVWFKETDPQQYSLFVLRHTVIVSLQRQVTVPVMLLQVDGVEQFAEGKVE